jgi:hypothetical protein
MACVRSVKFKIQININLTEEIVPSRGLRQGDPLSPYLFLFVVESLSKILHKAALSQNLKEFKICRNSPRISHLLFTDDCLLFFQENAQQAEVIKSAICTFGKGLGQLLSANKCSLLFRDNCLETSQKMVREILEVERETFEDKYLGLPTPEGRMNKGKFQSNKDRLKKKLTNWEERYMSMAAKEPLSNLLHKTFQFT